MAINPKLLNPGETVVVDTREHPKAILVPLLILVVLIAAGVAFMVLVTTGVAAIVVWVVLALLAVWFVGRPFVDWLSSTYTITDRRLITRHGIITRRGHDIPLSRISDVEYEMGLLDRVLGCGTLRISDASTDGEVTLHDIPDVEQTQRRLNVLLNDLHSGETRSSEGT